MNLQNDCTLKQLLFQFSEDNNLTPREREIVYLLLKGFTSNEKIAANLNISQNTASNHTKSILEKIGGSTKTDILVSFLKNIIEITTHCRLFAKKPRILIIDDEVSILELLQRVLSGKGFKVYIETNSEQALKKIPELNLDFIISDIKMPVLDGFHFLRELRKTLPYFPIVFLMSASPEYNLEQCCDAGAADFFQKPVDTDKLFFTVMEHFIDSPYEKNRLYRTNTNIPVNINNTVRLKIGNLGFGGVFIPSTTEGLESLSVKSGDIIEFQFCLEEQKIPINVKGEIVWTRAKHSADRPSGMGIKFIEMREKDRESIHCFIRSNKIRSFIPMGT